MLNEMFPTVPKSNGTTVGTGAKYIPIIHIIHDRSLSWIGSETSIEQVWLN